MTMRTAEKTVTFDGPFALAGFDEVLPAGAYRMELEEELLDAMFFPDCLRQSAVLHLQPLPRFPGLSRSLAVHPHDVDAALAQDKSRAGRLAIQNKSPHTGWFLDQVRKPAAALLLLLLVLASLVVNQGSAVAAETPIAVPANAMTTPDGRGWSCDRGYRESAGACAAIVVPGNAYSTLSPYGSGWECDRGYRQVGETCIAIPVPDNAFLTASGSGWKCDRGYRQVKETCVAISLPENAYLTGARYGFGWSCERGYRAANNQCNAVAVPENAHLDHSGNDWECNRPYRKRANACVLP